jgi:hypothetical protein
MNGLQRTLEFLAGRPVDRQPFHPIIMRWAARYAGVNTATSASITDLRRPQ